MVFAHFYRTNKSTVGGSTALDHASVDKGNPAETTSGNQSIGSPSKSGKVAIVSNPTPMYEAFITTSYFDSMICFTQSGHRNGRWDYY